MLRRLLFLTLLWCVLSCTPLRPSAASVVWVNDGRPQARIVIPNDPSTSELRSAQDLQLHIRLLTEVELPLIALDKPPRTIAVPRLKQPHQGQPDQVDWSQAAKLTFADRFGNPLDIPVTGLICHDRQNLYIQLLRPYVHGPLQSHPNVFSDNSWEIFLAPTRNLPYFIFATNPAGQIAELAFYDPGQGGQPWASAAHAVNLHQPEQSRWLVYVAILMKHIGIESPRPGTRIHANIFYGLLRAALGPTFEDNHHVQERMVVLELK